MDSTNTDTALPKIDWEHLHHISDDSPDFELELLQLFVADSQTQMEQLQEAIASRNFVEIEQLAHHIKGASANIGAIEMQAAAGALEQQARQNQLENTDELSAILIKSLHQLYTYVKTNIRVDNT